MLGDLGTADPRVRRYLMPERVVWASPDGTRLPGNLLLDNRLVCELHPTGGDNPPGVLLDFGRELHGGVRIEVPNTSTGRPARVRVRFGESVSEAMGMPNNDHAIHDSELLVAWMGHTEHGNTGFRFVRLDLLDTETAVAVERVRAVLLFRPLEYRGAFECNDERLNQIWRTGAYTVHLCMQDLVWDGIKRDRLPWIGDLHPEARVASTVFGEQEVVPATLDFVRDQTPLPGWMNGISSYSLWWLMCHWDWYRYHGNTAYLGEQRPYLLGLLRQVRDCLDDSGQERLDGHRFLEWPTSGDPTAINAGLQALTVLALRAGADLCDVLGEREAAALARADAQRAASCNLPLGTTKQANALAVLAGMADAVETNASLLSVAPCQGLSTFYGYYVLEARALAGDYDGCLDLIRAYWGGMLDMGATTFWEGFDVDWMPGSAGIAELVPPGTRDIHADYGDYCYKGLRHSLCHGWAAGPTAWLTERILGLRPGAPGCRTVIVDPHLGTLSYARGALPTPYGVVRVTHERGADGLVHTSIEAPPEVCISQSPPRA